MILLEHTAALLEWDEETQMPPEGLEGRAAQISLLKGYIHDLTASPEMGEALEACGDELSVEDRALRRIHKREYDRAVKVPKALVVAMSEAESRGQNAWVSARKDEDFASFAPYLEKIISLKREYAEAVGYEGVPYNALLDDYEPGMTAAQIDGVFAPLKTEVLNLLEKIRSCPQADDRFLYKEYPRDLQDQFGRQVLHDMGFDFKRGQLAEAVHPFTTTVGYDDVRITTRYTEPSVSSPLFSTIHEGGHGLYELGASNERTRGTVLADGVSMAIHESQSRLWENIIGRSGEFWEYYYPQLQGLFPSQLGGITKGAFLQGINRVEPSFIRVNADEVTYNLHIILRYELEKQLVSGDLKVGDLPEAWNSLMQELLGITPEKPSDGVLQDVHWSAGLIGYFPTYALGNLYGAQFYRTLLKQLPNTPQRFAEGNLHDTAAWLEKEIYQRGSIYEPAELLRKVTGEVLDSSCFIEYLWDKYAEIYTW